jgi:hypothetical protein
MCAVRRIFSRRMAIFGTLLFLFVALALTSNPTSCEPRLPDARCPAPPGQHPSGPLGQLWRPWVGIIAGLLGLVLTVLSRHGETFRTAVARKEPNACCWQTRWMREAKRGPQCPPKAPPAGRNWLSWGLSGQNAYLYKRSCNWWNRPGPPVKTIQRPKSAALPRSAGKRICSR